MSPQPDTSSAEILSPLGAAERMAPPWLSGESVGDWIAKLALDPRQPVVAVLNGEPLLRADWGRRSAPGDQVAAMLLPGGQGGGSGAKILQIVAMIAIAVAAAYTGGLAAGALGPVIESAAAGIVGSVVSVAVTMIGGLLLNALMPAPEASKPDTGGAVSPTYSFRATGNLARLGQPIPRGYGRFRMIPDYAAAPYQEYVNDDQYVSQLFCLGLGHYDLEQIQLDDTVLWRKESLRSLGLAAGTVPPGSGAAVDGFIATGAGSIAYTTVSGRAALIATNAVALHRVAAASIAGETVSAKCYIEARTGSALSKLAVVFRNSGLTEIEREEVTLAAATTGEGLKLRDLKLPSGTAWIDIEVGPAAGSSTATVSGIELFEGGLDGSFDNVELQLVPPGEQVTLFPANVETNSEAGGQELLGTNQSGYDWVGPFAANSPGTETNKLAIDVMLPTGLFETTETGSLTPATVSWEVQARLIDDEGTPLSSFFQIGSHTLTRRSRRALRITNAYPVPFGRFEVRLRRTNAIGDITRADALVWDGLKAYLPDDATWDHVTLLAVRIKATNQISTVASRRVATVLQALIPVWNGTTWSAPQATRSIAWAYADAARNAVYGSGLPDSRIDLEALLVLDTLWAGRGDRFDFVFDTRRTIWEALKSIGRAGRAQPVQIGHILTLRRDQEQSLAKAVFTPANIVRGSFKLQYVLQDDETPDAVEVHYVDEETWQPETVLCALPGSSAEAPQVFRMEGVQNRAQAFREGITLAAINGRRRTFAGFETERQGRLLVRGDPIIVSHDLPQWGWWGRATSWDAETLTLRLDQPISWVEGPTHYMSLRRKDGREWGPVVVERGADDYEVVIDATDHDLVAAGQGKTADEVIVLDPDWEETNAVVGPGAEYLKRFLLVETRPRGERTQILAVNDDPAVHTAEIGVFPDPLVGSLLPTRRAGPVLEGLFIVIAADAPPSAPVLECSWRPSADAEYYIGQRSSDGETWTTIYEASGVGAAIPVPPGTSFVRFAAFGTLRGPWSIWQTSTPIGEEPGPLELAIFGHINDYNIKTAALAAGWDGEEVIDVKLTIFNGVRVGSTSLSTPGLRTGTSWPDDCTITIDNYGTVYGRGGTGGAGGASGAGSAGGTGGDAYWNEGVPVTFNNYGTLAGGGGGGGGGGKGVSGGIDQAGGGGGGARGLNGGTGGSAGGSGAVGGTAGSFTAAGTGGVGKSVSFPEEGQVQIGGSGGTGGQLGSNGQAGWAGTTGSAGGAGGAPGKAVKGDSDNTWGATGTRLGGVQSAAP